MAKIKGILETKLCDKTAQEAINNMIAQGREEELEEDTELGLSHILMTCFTWFNTPEGEHYWRNVTEEAKYYEDLRIKEAAQQRLNDMTTGYIK